MKVTTNFYAFTLAASLLAGGVSVADPTDTNLGVDALASETTGSRNTAVGYSALSSNTSAEQNSAFGDLALCNNVTGHDNTSVGAAALYFNQTGSYNTATGSDVLEFNTASNNTGVGFNALQNTPRASLSWSAHCLRGLEWPELTPKLCNHRENNRGDHLHFSTKSQNILGQRYAAEYLKLKRAVN